MESLIKERAIYRYSKGKGHARHGIIYTIKDKANQMWAVDTYWHSRFPLNPDNDYGLHSIAKIAEDLEFVMMIDDVKEVGENEFDLYDYKDKFYIPVGGTSERYLVNKNAKKNVDTIIKQIQYKIDESQRKIKSLHDDVGILSAWLDEIKTNPEIAQRYTNSNYVNDIAYYIN